MELQPVAESHPALSHPQTAFCFSSPEMSLTEEFEFPQQKHS